jgi:nucleotide-binding universal stress UspA family protein
MKNILVPTDFSETSRNATKYAVSLAQSFDATVILINVVAPPVIIDDSIFASVMVTQAEIIDESKKLMEQEIEAFSKKYAVKVIGSVSEGYASDIISELPADLIVMGMKGQEKSNSVFGSTTTTVIRNSTYPVFVIPQEAVYKQAEHITLAADFDAEIEMDSYAVLLALAEKFNSHIDIVNVQKNASSMNQEKVIGKMQTNVAFSKLNHKFHSINEKNVEEGINKFIEQSSADILAMVAQKHTLFERLFGKVHTKAMSYQTKIPLLVLQNK